MALEGPQLSLGTPSPIEVFAVEGYHGEVVTACRLRDLEASVQTIVDPASARETLHWGRNYIYSVELDTAAGPLRVAVKQFRNQGLRARWRRRMGRSKARRSWHGARALVELGVPTAEPIMLIESDESGGPSFFVTRPIKRFFETRYFFRALAAGRAEELFPSVDARQLLEQIGGNLRRLHDGGVWHRDVSVGNLLVQAKDRDSPPRVFLIDLNRARVGGSLSISQRTRDLCRLRVFRADLQEVLLRAYWGNVGGLVLRRLLYRTYFYGFLAKNRAKGLLRPVRGLGRLVIPRRAHVHIPAPPKASSRRDRAVWDRLSDQPHQHAGRLHRTAVRLNDIGLHGREVAAGARAMPRFVRRYLELRGELYRRPVEWKGVGIAIRPLAENPEAVLTALRDLGVRQVLIRLHPWQDEHTHEEELARELKREGYELAFALPQNRELVRDLEHWRASVSEIAERFRPFGRHFQVGQAINRSKWGVWNHREYFALLTAAREILNRDGDVEILGPAIIDYEFYYFLSLLNLKTEGVFFDVVTSLLYVDRRGAPENRQIGFDTVDKVVQLKALADTALSARGRCWITEFNWPLREGPHSPAGRSVAVDEETQADYLVRYFLAALCSGMVERVYWWQLLARGYGLSYTARDGHLVRRPSFAALATLCRQLDGLVFVRPLAVEQPGRLYLFRAAAGSEVVVGWSAGAPTTGALPRAVREVVERDGTGALRPRHREVELVSSPRYFWLEDRGSEHDLLQRGGDRANFESGS